MKNFPKDISIFPLPVPPSFEYAMGYPGDRRWVAFFWSPCGDELEFDDGYSGGTIDWRGWIEFSKHPITRSAFTRFNFGSSETEADHWLLLDRQERRFYAGDKRTIYEFLRTFISQIKSDPVEVDFQSAKEILQTLVMEKRKVLDFKFKADEYMKSLKLWLDELLERVISDHR